MPVRVAVVVQLSIGVQLRNAAQGEGGIQVIRAFYVRLVFAVPFAVPHQMDAGGRSVAARDGQRAVVGGCEFAASVRRDGFRVAAYVRISQGGVRAGDLVLTPAQQLCLAGGIVVSVEAYRVMAGRVDGQQFARIVRIIILREKFAEPGNASARRAGFEGIDVVRDGGAEHLGKVDTKYVFNVNGISCHRAVPVRSHENRDIIISACRRPFKNAFASCPCTNREQGLIECRSLITIAANKHVHIRERIIVFYVCPHKITMAEKRAHHVPVNSRARIWSRHSVFKYIVGNRNASMWSAPLGI